MTLSPLIGAIAARLAGADEIRLFDDQAVVKMPDDGDADDGPGDPGGSADPAGSASSGHV